MKTLKELEEKMWYRFFKVLYFVLAIPYLPLLFRKQVFKELNKEALRRSLKADIKTYQAVLFKGLFILFLILYTFVVLIIILFIIYKPSLPPLPGMETPTIKIYHAIPFFIMYFLVVESLRRAFYYIVIGKLFPKEQERA